MDSPSAPRHAPRHGPRRVAFRVDGRVQGVGFRWSTQRAASTSSVTGWVRNEPDGAVCGEAQGNLDTFLSFLQSGPPGSNVEWFDAVELPMIRDENGFEILR